MITSDSSSDQITLTAIYKRTSSGLGYLENPTVGVSETIFLL
jgi:hypothetical protein